jgi:hypothetical protein
MILLRSYLKNAALLLILASFGACQGDKDPENNQVMIKPSSGGPVINGNFDKSPMDMSYYPVDYPKLKMTKTETEPLVARIIYSRPKKDGRIIFGNVLKYGERWRMGANEATEVEFFKDVHIHDHRVEKGRYVIYCVPFADNWKLILNNDLFTWGLQIDSAKDIYSFNVPVIKNRYPFEMLTMEFSKADAGMNLNIAWDSVKVVVPIKY